MGDARARVTDKISKEKRSWVMSHVRSVGNKSTEGRMLVLLKQEKIRGWRRHLKLPGTPDFTFPKERVCVFVDGCFWHGCTRCYSDENPKRNPPASNTEYWQRKVAGNVKRDRVNSRRLRAMGFAVIRVRECELKKPNPVAAKIIRKLAR